MALTVNVVAMNYRLAESNSSILSSTTSQRRRKQSMSSLKRCILPWGTWTYPRACKQLPFMSISLELSFLIHFYCLCTSACRSNFFVVQSNHSCYSNTSQHGSQNWSCDSICFQVIWKVPIGYERDKTIKDGHESVSHVASFLPRLGLPRCRAAFETSTRQFLDKITTNEDLKAVLTYHFGDYGTQPARAPLAMQVTIESVGPKTETRRCPLT